MGGSESLGRRRPTADPRFSGRPDDSEFFGIICAVPEEEFRPASEKNSHREEARMCSVGPHPRFDETTAGLARVRARSGWSVLSPGRGTRSRAREFEEIIDGPLIVRVRTVPTRDHATIGSDEEIRRKSEGPTAYPCHRILRSACREGPKGGGPSAWVEEGASRSFHPELGVEQLFRIGDDGEGLSLHREELVSGAVEDGHFADTGGKDLVVTASDGT